MLLLTVVVGLLADPLVLTVDPFVPELLFIVPFDLLVVSMLRLSEELLSLLYVPVDVDLLVVPVLLPVEL